MSGNDHDIADHHYRIVAAQRFQFCPNQLGILPQLRRPLAGVAGGGFDGAAQRRPGQGEAGAGRARADHHAAGVDRGPAGDGQPRLSDVAAAAAKGA